MSPLPLRSISAGLAAACIAAVHAPGCMLDRQGTAGDDGSGGSDGTPLPCESPSDCGTASDCSNPKCTDGTCSVRDDDAGTPCRSAGNFCDGEGVCLPGSCIDDAECDTCSLDGIGPRYAQQEGTCEADACTSGSLTSCGNYVCNGSTCKANCTGNTDCIEGTRCDDGVCGNPGANGATCSAAEQCLGGFCVDSVCCEGECAGTCEACSMALTGEADGTCAPLTERTDPDDECAMAPP